MAMCKIVVFSFLLRKSSTIFTQKLLRVFFNRKKNLNENCSDTCVSVIFKGFVNLSTVLRDREEKKNLPIATKIMKVQSTLYYIVKNTIMYRKLA